MFSGLPPDHSTSALITKTSILVWSCSHSVRTLMRNMWSCPDTQSEETQSFTPSVSLPFPSPFPPLSHSFCLAHALLPLRSRPLSAPLFFKERRRTGLHFAASSSFKCRCQMPSASISTLFSLSPCLYLKLFFVAPPPKPPPTFLLQMTHFSRWWWVVGGGGAKTQQPGSDALSRASPVLCVWI